MATSKNSPIVYVEDFIENRGMKSLIEAQANTQTGTIDDRQINGQDAPKVKKKGYVRINQPKK